MSKDLVPRQLEAIVRISESLAKMELREEADVSHVEEALRLFTVGLPGFKRADVSRSRPWIPPTGTGME